MKIFLLSLLFGFNFLAINAQRAQSVYAELLGNGVFYSLNYDMRFAKIDNQFGIRVGASYYGEAAYFIVQPNYLFGTNQHKFELGIGLTALAEFRGKNDGGQLVASGALMYRFQKQGSNFLFRAGLAPTFLSVEENDTFSGLARAFWVWPGVSFGYKF